MGLRNIGFSIHVGAKDGAYRRNAFAAEWGKQFADLQSADPKGYAHHAEVHEGKGHWMDLQDAKAVGWMEKFTRNPFPEKVVWQQDDVTQPHFYWLSVPKEEARAGATITAERQGQQITLDTKDTKQITVRLTDAMLDLDQPVIILQNGRQVFRSRATRTIASLWSTLAERGDPGLMFSAEVKLPAAN
ncbi:MAG: hypothetical protein EOP84_17125 [Verrucomicrobiaceae bacterium]|nr:MAG: hypothetical protein EOP84_17125 [Verrucomicrobiaceae bacterium]